MRNYKFNLTDYLAVQDAYSEPLLKQVCEMHEFDFAHLPGMVRCEVNQKAPDNYFYYKDNGSDILAVAHLDTCVNHNERTAAFVETEDGPVVFSGALDDRLGAYIILFMLPVLGINVDILLTVGEESGCSTAQFFAPPKDYKWMIEFDRGDTDVVMYQYHDDDTEDLVRECGAKVGLGSFSDVAYLEHLGVKGFNWGVAYQDYHSTRGHAFLNDTFYMVSLFMEFHRTNKDVSLPHVQQPSYGYSSGRYGGFGLSQFFDEERPNLSEGEIACEDCTWEVASDGDTLCDICRWYQDKADEKSEQADLFID